MLNEPAYACGALLYCLWRDRSGIAEGGSWHSRGWFLAATAYVASIPYKMGHKQILDTMCYIAPLGSRHVLRASAATLWATHARACCANGWTPLVGPPCWGSKGRGRELWSPGERGRDKSERETPPVELIRCHELNFLVMLKFSPYVLNTIQQ